MNQDQESDRPSAIAASEKQEAHRKTWDALPWLVNGSLNEPGRAQLRLHLLECLECREEYAFQRRLSSALRLPDPDRELRDPEQGLQRLMQRLDDAQAARAPRQRPGLQRCLLAAVVLEAMGLVLLGGQLLVQRTQAREADYRTLSQETSPAVAADIQLVLRPEISAGRMRSLMLDHGLEIVGGPTPAGVLSLALRGDRTSPDLSTRLAELRREPGVLLAEPVGRPQ